MAKPPKWMFKHVQKCRQAFGIGGDDFEFILKTPDAIEGRSDLAGNVTTSMRYRRAVVAIKRGIEKDDWGYEVVTHEVLHAATGAQRQAVTQIISLLPEDQHEFAEQLWADGNEATVTL